MRIIALSDTHGFTSVAVPDGDVLVFAGDATKHGTVEQMTDFIGWFARFPHKWKLYVAGNHDASVFNEPEIIIPLMQSYGITYLIDSDVVIDGVKFYGSPWMPEYNNWYFMMERGSKKLKQMRRDIPEDTEVLITHCPPYGILDQSYPLYGQGGAFLGCEVLRERIDSGLRNLKAHIFGHIHEQHGSKHNMFYNVAICNRSYEPVNPSTIVDI